MAWPRWGGGDREWEESGKFDNERGTERGRKREGRGRRHRETRKKDKGPPPTIASTASFALSGLRERGSFPGAQGRSWGKGSSAEERAILGKSISGWIVSHGD